MKRSIPLVPARASRVALIGGALVLAGALGTACGGGEHQPPGPDADTTPDGRPPMPPDARPDADYSDAMPPPLDDGGMLAFGPGVVLDHIAMPESGHALAPYAPVANAQFDLAVANGSMIVLLELRGLDDPAGQADPDGLDLAIFTGEDPDNDANDNFSGEETLRVSADSLNALGLPRSVLPDATLAGGMVEGHAGGPMLVFLAGLGELPLFDVSFGGMLIPGPAGDRVARVEGGFMTGLVLARDLAAIANPVPDFCFGESLLDVIALGCLSIPGVMPDVDLDGDGLETFYEKQYDGAISFCQDGNGDVYQSAPGIPCALDTAFQDGYTVAFDLTAVRAVLIAPTAP